MFFSVFLDGLDDEETLKSNSTENDNPEDVKTQGRASFGKRQVENERRFC